VVFIENWMHSTCCREMVSNDIKTPHNKNREEGMHGKSCTIVTEWMTSNLDGVSHGFLLFGLSTEHWTLDAIKVALWSQSNSKAKFQRIYISLAAFRSCEHYGVSEMLIFCVGDYRRIQPVRFICWNSNTSAWKGRSFPWMSLLAGQMRAGWSDWSLGWREG
jgi:hypothetical protein